MSGNRATKTLGYGLNDQGDTPPGWLSLQEGRLLQKQAEEAKLRNVLEIGVFCGRSTAFILRGLRNRFPDNNFLLWCVEPWHLFRQCFVDEIGVPPKVFWDYMSANGYCNNLRVLQCNSQEASPTIMQRKYDFAFIDGGHNAPWVWHDLIMCSAVTKTIILHDYLDADNEYDVKETVTRWLEVTDWKLTFQLAETVKLTAERYNAFKKIGLSCNGIS